MSEDAPVNSGAVKWPHPDSAYFTVRSMQIKLHRWAGEDSSRRFGDLFNLVCDPAFLVHAWERVSGNKGARTPGVDKATVAMIETWVGVEEFLGQIRDSLKSGEFRPVEVRQTITALAAMLYGNVVFHCYSHTGHTILEMAQYTVDTFLNGIRTDGGRDGGGRDDAEPCRFSRSQDGTIPPPNQDKQEAPT